MTNKPILVALCLALTACAQGGKGSGAAEDPALRLAESDAGRTIELERGKRITLRLEANHSTGYSWAVATSGDGALERLGEPFYAVEKSVPGGGGAEYWTFRAVRSGKQEMRFEYRRPWEREKPPARVLGYAVEVR